MKHKLTRRLIVSFSLILVSFALLVGVMFTCLFAEHSAQIYAEDLQAHAVSIADTVTQFVQNYASGACRGGGFRSYFRFIGDVARCEIWLIDEQLHPVQLLDGGSMQTEIPTASEAFVRHILEDDQPDVLDSSVSRHMNTLIAGAPVHDTQGRVRFALLLRRAIDNQDLAFHSGLAILARCLATALALGILLSVLLSRRLITPLHQMILATQQMMNGQYDVSTGVTQDDEVGTLALRIDALSARLLKAERAQQELDAMRQSFFSNISHELRTPISVLKGSLEVLVDDLIADPEERAAYLRQMLADTNHMERLVNDLLELSRLRDVHFKIERAQVNLIDVLQETVRFLRPTAAAKSIPLSLSGDLAPFPVMGDYARLRQLFTILLDNAIRYSPDGRPVEVRLTQCGNACTAVVRDHGVGIPPEDLPHIFDRFYRQHAVGHPSGTGLGLSIAREIALRHHVDMTCDSVPGAGTRLTLTFRDEA